MRATLINSLSLLIADTKRYISQIDPSTHLNLSKAEKSYYFQEINDLSPIKRDEKTSKISSQKIENTPPLSAIPKKKIEEAPKTASVDRQKKSFFQEKLPPKKSTLGNSSSSITFTELEKPEKSIAIFNEIKKIIQTIAPDFPLSDLIPSDAKAKQISQSWKIKKDAADVTILSHKESPQQRLFLKNLADALDKTLLPTKLISAREIENENGWETLLSQRHLKLIIACDYCILELENLIRFYHENPVNKLHFLNKIPLFLLPDVSLYFKEPLLKKSLWASLRKKIHSLPYPKEL